MKKREVKKAVITAAGYGTRFLPATKNVPKEMLPLIDTPIIHYIVEECVKSGIEDIIIVTRYGNSAVEDYFDSLYELEDFLRKTRKYDRLEEVQSIYKMANFAFVRQNKDLPYGNGSPIIAAKPFIGNDNFAVAWGDDITINDVPVIKQIVQGFNSSDCAGAIAVKEVAREEIQRYGSVKFKGEGSNQLDKIIEKPKPGEEFSNLASFGRYVFSPQIFDYLNPENTGKDGELWLVDAIHKLAKDHSVVVKKIEGKWHTTGDPLRYLKTTFDMALEREDIRDDLVDFLRERVC